MALKWLRCGPRYSENAVMAKFAVFSIVLTNALGVRFDPRLGTKNADSGAIRARFVVEMSSGADFFNRLSSSKHFGE